MKIPTGYTRLPVGTPLKEGDLILKEHLRSNEDHDNSSLDKWRPCIGHMINSKVQFSAIIRKGKK